MKTDMDVSEIDARNIFSKGDRVTLTSAGLGLLNPKQKSQAFLGKRPTSGIVTGFAIFDRHCVSVKLDGRKSSATYSWWFWKRLAKGAHSER